jgi:hypothetical protein
MRCGDQTVRDIIRVFNANRASGLRYLQAGGLVP